MRSFFSVDSSKTAKGRVKVLPTELYGVNDRPITPPMAILISLSPPARLRPRSASAQTQLASGDVPVEVFSVKFRPNNRVVVNTEQGVFGKILVESLPKI